MGAEMEIEDGIAALLRDRAAALLARDAAAFLAGYLPEARVFDLAPPLAHGPDGPGIAAWMASWDGAIGSAIAQLSVHRAGELAILHGLERLHGLQGGEPRDVWMRLTLALVRGPDGWRISHEHVSLPVARTGAGLVALVTLRP